MNRRNLLKSVPVMTITAMPLASAANAATSDAPTSVPAALAALVERDAAGVDALGMWLRMPGQSVWLDFEQGVITWRHVDGADESEWLWDDEGEES